MMEKYQKTMHMTFHEFYKSMGQDKLGCWSLDMMHEHTSDEYRVYGIGTTQGNEGYNLEQGNL